MRARCWPRGSILIYYKPRLILYSLTRTVVLKSTLNQFLDGDVGLQWHYEPARCACRVEAIDAAKAPQPPPLRGYDRTAISTDPRVGAFHGVETAEETPRAAQGHG